MAYLDLAAYKARSVLPPEWIDEAEFVSAGWVDTQLGMISALQVDAPLAKRYQTPFEAPYPVAILAWVARIMEPRVLLRRGINPSDDQFQLIFEDARTAVAEIKEAANAETGLYDLPLRGDTTASGISKGRPRHYSSASPYVWMSKQSRRGREEDSNGDGTTR